MRFARDSIRSSAAAPGGAWCMRRRADTVIARGWLDGVSQVLGLQSVAIQVRECGETHNVWVRPETISRDPIALQSIVVVRSTSPVNNAQRPASEIEVVRPPAAAVQGESPWALKIRSPQMRLRATVRHRVEAAIREYLDTRGCIAVHSPLQTEGVRANAEDQVALPDRSVANAALKYSGWMFVDAMVDTLERVYALSPVFRAESAATPVHEVQTWSLQTEIAWATPEEIMQWEAGLLAHIAGLFLKDHAHLLEQAGRAVQPLERWQQAFPAVGYEAALKILARGGMRTAFGCALTAQERTLLDQEFDTPYFVTELPWALTAYAAVGREGDPEITQCHWLMPRTGQGELAVGGERASAWTALPAGRRRGNDPAWFQVPWFAETRRQGCMPHSGFELDFGRLCALVLGASDAELARPVL
jgi:asparaginyl-tRNA synthetase